MSAARTSRESSYADRMALCRDDARESIGGAARGERDDHANRFHGLALRSLSGRTAHERGDESKEPDSARVHGFFQCWSADSRVD